MTIIEVVVLPRVLHETAEVLVFFAIIGLVAVALAELQPKRRRKR